MTTGELGGEEYISDRMRYGLGGGDSWGVFKKQCHLD